MGTRTQGRPRSRRGANAIEFALTAPVLIFLILGIMDYGWFFLNRILLESSTARVAYVGSIVIGDEAMTQGDIALMQGQSTWDNFNIPGDPTFTTEVQVVGGVNVINATGTLPYSRIALPEGLMPARTIRIVVSRRMENQFPINQG